MKFTKARVPFFCLVLFANFSYAAICWTGAVPTLTNAFQYSCQSGAYDACGAGSSVSCEASVGKSDFWKFVYDPSTQKAIHVYDHQVQAGIVVVLYDAAGNEIHCNKWNSGNATTAYTWDLSVLDGITMHMPNISLQELGLTSGATYYVRVCHTSSSWTNAVCDGGRKYSIRIGAVAPAADTYLTAPVLTVNGGALSGQSNLRAGQATNSEPEGTASGYAIHNSMIYTFNSGSYTTVNVNLTAMTYYCYTFGPTVCGGQISVQTSPTGGSSLKKGTFYEVSSYSLTSIAVAANTDYWIVVDGEGDYQGTQWGFSIAVSASVLPITLGQFSATVQNNNQVSLKWNTLSESNTNKFVLLREHETTRKEDMGDPSGYIYHAGEKYTEVKEVGTVSAKNAASNYEFVDNAVSEAGTYIYELHEIDMDGAYYNLGRVEVYVTAPAQFVLNNVYPNPVFSSLTVDYTLDSDSKIDITIYNMLGESVYSNSILRNAGYYKEMVEISKLRAGSYIIQIKSDAKKITGKFVKIE